MCKSEDHRQNECIVSGVRVGDGGGGEGLKWMSVSEGMHPMDYMDPQVFLEG